MGWVTFIKETFGTNGNAVKYLARYAYRTAISNARITEVTDETVSFRWKNYKNGGAMEEMYGYYIQLAREICEGGSYKEGPSNEIRGELIRLGADIVGIGDLTEIPMKIRKSMRYGISVAVAINPAIIRKIAEGPTEEYFETYLNLNNKLDEIVSRGTEFLHSKGYEAIAQTREEVSKNESQYSTILPYKTVATRSGIGWIGICAMLVTEKYGSAIRLSAILTNAPLEADAPVKESHCGDCKKCRDECPGKAVKGLNWSIHSNREDIFEPKKCRRAARKLCNEILNKEITLCGKCVYVCPYTQKYLQRE